MDDNEITGKIIKAAIGVHRHLGPGLLESSYEECLCHELKLEEMIFKSQVPLPIMYKGIKLDCVYQMDLVVEDRVVVELKSVDKIMPIHEAQLLTYLKLSGYKIGLLINFNVTLLKDGIVRLSN